VGGAIVADIFEKSPRDSRVICSAGDGLLPCLKLDVRRGTTGSGRGRIGAMRILTAKFVNGRLDLPDGSVHEGDTVTLLVPESEKAFDLTDEERTKLAEAVAEIDRGAGVDGWRLLDDLKG
jgi:hypothetical protein